jgi:hypothetical protein
LSGSQNLVVSFTIFFAFLGGAGATPALIGMFGREGCSVRGISLVEVFMTMGMVLAGFLRLL